MSGNGEWVADPPRSAAAFFKRMAQAGKDILFPPRCLFCNVFLADSTPPCFCDDCLKQLPLVGARFCDRCGEPAPNGAASNPVCCHKCINVPSHSAKKCFLLRYNADVARMVHRFKFQKDFSMLPSIAALFRRSAIRRSLAPYDTIIPVPLSGIRLRQRGFNQSFVLASALFPDCADKIMAGLMKCSHKRRPQRGLSRNERLQNIRGIFHIVQPELVRKKDILLVDDVYTTGATIDECSEILIRSGASNVKVFTLARVDLKK